MDKTPDIQYSNFLDSHLNRPKWQIDPTHKHNSFTMMHA